MSSTTTDAPTISPLTAKQPQLGVSRHEATDLRRTMSGGIPRRGDAVKLRFIAERVICCLAWVRVSAINPDGSYSGILDTRSVVPEIPSKDADQLCANVRSLYEGTPIKFTCENVLVVGDSDAIGREDVAGQTAASRTLAREFRH